MSSTPSPTGSPDVRELLAQWNKEDQALEQALREIQEWLLQVGALKPSPFEETARRLTIFREALLCHFAREDALCEQLSALYSAPCPEVEAACRQSNRGHAELLGRLETLMDRLHWLEPSRGAWQQVVDQLDSLVDAVEQHEEQESENLQALLRFEP